MLGGCKVWKHNVSMCGTGVKLCLNVTCLFVYMDRGVTPPEYKGTEE